MSETIEVHVNGAATLIPERTTIAALVASRDLRPELVAVELNRVIVPRKLHAETQLDPGDRVEIVTLVGGG